MRKIEVKHVQQPTPRACVHACLAMVTGEDVHSLLDRFGDHGLCWHEEATVLVEHQIWPTLVPAQQPHEFPRTGVYLVTVPSLNLRGKTHRVVVEADGQGYCLHDPNAGRDGVKAYGRDAIQTGQARYLDVTYLDPMPLRKMRRVWAEVHA